MVKKLVSILLLLALIGSNFSRYFVFAGFQINKKYIVENLCENRMRPQLQCNGKCYLTKKLKQAEETEKKQAEKKVESKNEIILSFKSFYAVVNRTYKLNIVKQLFPQIRNDYSYNCTNTIFHPPEGVKYHITGILFFIRK